MNRLRLPLAARWPLLVAAALLLPGTLAAQTVLLDYDRAPSPDFLATPYAEDGTTTTVQAGHYEIVADATGPEGDGVFQIDEQEHGLSVVTVRVDGHFFHAVGLDVVNPTEAAGEVTIRALGGAGGSTSAPTVAGPLALGPAFENIYALEIAQTAPGAFSFDDLELTLAPEPGAATGLASGLAALAALAGRRRAAA